MRGWKRVSHATYESSNYNVDGNDDVKIPITLANKYLDHDTIKIVPPLESYDASSVSQHKPECHIIVLNEKS